MSSDSFSLINKTRGTLPRVPFRAIKDAVLGPRYALSLALLTPADSKRVTKRTKGEQHASNVLSFPLSPRSGEVLLCPAAARREAADWHTDQRTFIALLFIHGLLHLKGYAHGGTMEKAENRILEKFGFEAIGVRR